MYSKGVRDRVLACAPTMWAAFAYSEFIVEAIRRLLPKLEAKFNQRQAERGDDPIRQAGGSGPKIEPNRSISISQFIRGFGAKLGSVRDRMVAADRARERERAALEEHRRQRDELVKTIYDRVVWARDLYEERVGRRRTTSRLAITGETPRDPEELLKAARLAAENIANPEVALKKMATAVHLPEQRVAEDLMAECERLEASLEAIGLRESEEKSAISVREQRIAEFDELRGNVGRFLERLLELVELPTLAAAVRPELEGTGRRGRPSKRVPRDLFPDLVDAALALDPEAGLTLEQLRDLVPRRPAEYHRPEDVPIPAEVMAALVREAAAFRGRLEEAGAEAPNRLERESLGGPGAVEGLKDWLADLGRAVLGRRG